MPEIKAISLGWGVQSWTMAVMVALGDLPPVYFAIHSDTQWEREETYTFADKWIWWLNERGVKVVTVSDTKQALLAGTGKTDAPFFTRDETGDVFGQLRRQCTNRWKIVPVRRFLSDVLKKRGLSKSGGVVEQWIGITMDEYQRMKSSDVKYIKHRFPLIEMRMTRQDCLLYLQYNGIQSPGKSACVFCPYHSRAYWQQMKREGGRDWETSISIDHKIRDQRLPYLLFVHPARKPLVDSVSIPEDYGMTQPSMFDFEDAAAPCDGGHCFL